MGNWVFSRHISGQIQEGHKKNKYVEIARELSKIRGDVGFLQLEMTT